MKGMILASGRVGELGGGDYASDAMMTACSIALTSEQLSGRSPQAYDQDEERHDLLCSPAQS